MPVYPGPFHIDDTRLVLGPGGDATPMAVSTRFYEELEAAFNGFAGHVLISRHAFAEAWPGWEMHPNGDEFVYLLSGDVDLVLWRGRSERDAPHEAGHDGETLGGGETALRLAEPGAYVVVPKGTWHTARPRAPSALLFVTPGEGTEHAERPPSGA